MTEEVLVWLQGTVMLVVVVQQWRMVTLEVGVAWGTATVVVLVRQGCMRTYSRRWWFGYGGQLCWW